MLLSSVGAQGDPHASLGGCAPTWRCCGTVQQVPVRLARQVRLAAGWVALGPSQEMAMRGAFPAESRVAYSTM